MGRHGFTQLPTYQYDLEQGTTYQRKRQNLFSGSELAILLPLTTFTAGVGVFTVVYVVQNLKNINPAIVAALSGTSLVLAVVVFFVFRKLRRPSWMRVPEQGLTKPWAVGVPVQAPWPAMRHEIAGTRGSYALVPAIRSPSPEQPSTLATKVRFAINKSFGSSLLSRSSMDDNSSSNPQEDRGLLLPPGSGRSSGETLDGGREEEGLWESVFELPGDDKLQRHREANLKRLSREKRWSRFTIGGRENLVAEAETTSGVQIVLTKPEPAASKSQDLRASSAPSAAQVNLREVSLVFDPLRANPVHIKRDSSIRQIRSSQDLTNHCKEKEAAAAAIRRPRSAEPVPGRCRLEPELKGLGLESFSERAAAVRKSPASPAIRTERTERTVTSPKSKALRRAPSPLAGADRDLRTVFRTGL